MMQSHIFFLTSEQKYHYAQLKLVSETSPWYISNYISHQIWDSYNFFFVYGILCILFLIDFNIFQGQIVFWVWRIRTFRSLVSFHKYSARRTFWHYEYQCPFMSPDADMPTSHNLDDLIVKTEFNIKLVTDLEIYDLVLLPKQLQKYY